MDSFEQSFIADVIKRLNAYKELGDKTLAQLSEEDMHYASDEDSNSIAVIVQHMHGNMLSRFTNFLTEDGEKPWRKRDEEFIEEGRSKKEIIALWDEGWQCVMQALRGLQPDDLMKTVRIRTEPVLLYDAVLRQLAHYSYHVGQIVYIGKMRRGSEWQSLSIAKGGSKDYNQQMIKQLGSR